MAAMLGACATPQVEKLLASKPAALGTQDAYSSASLPRKSQLGNVPFLAQQAYHCGPAALAMVLAHAGLQPDYKRLADQVYTPGLQGALQVEMAAAVRRNGMLAYVIKPLVEDLLREVANGKPVVVLQNLSFAFAPKWHYAVVTGYDLDSNTIILHSGTTQGMRMSLFTFERTWSRADHWAMVTLAPGELPISADADRYVAAIAPLERVNASNATLAYAKALQKWPNNKAAMFGYANSIYATGNKILALRLYRQLVSQHANFADGWNNLAHVLMEEGNLQEAARAAEQAVRVGGDRLQQYLDLQNDIRKKSSAS